MRARSVVDEAVLLDDVRDLFFGVNPTGSLLWDAMAEAVTLQSLADLIASRFEVPRDEAWRDTVQFVTELERHGLVEVLDPPTDPAAGERNLTD